MHNKFSHPMMTFWLYAETFLFIYFFLSKFIPCLSASPRFFSPYFSWPDSCTRSRWAWPAVEVAVWQSLLSSKAGVLKKGSVRTDYREPFGLQTNRLTFEASWSSSQIPEWNHQHSVSLVEHLFQYCSLILTKRHPRAWHWATPLNLLSPNMDACCFVRVRKKRLKSLKCYGGGVIYNIVMVNSQWIEACQLEQEGWTFPLVLTWIKTHRSSLSTPS